MADLPTLISLGAILELPWYVGIPGLLVAGVLILSAMRALLSFRILIVLTRLAMAVAVLVILSQGGNAIMQLLGGNAGS